MEGVTPLMEEATALLVEVGSVLLERVALRSATAASEAVAGSAMGGRPVKVRGSCFVAVVVCREGGSWTDDSRLMD